MQRLVKISDLFDIKYGVNLELVNIEECKSSDNDSIPFVSRTEKNNGVSAFVYKMIDIDPNPGHTLSVAGGGSVLSTFYQPIPYYSGRDLYYLTPKREMNIAEMLYYAKCISSNKYKYNYGRQANKTLKDILIPENPEQNLIKIIELYYKKLKNDFRAIPINQDKISLCIDKWTYFKITDVFDISLGKPIHSIQLEESLENDLPYITRTGFNNGLAFFAEHSNFTDEKINNSNCITIGAEGFKAFYQPKQFVNGNKINILRNKKLNKYNALFLCLILNKELKDKFNYGRGATNERIKEISIKLPCINEKPDFKFMENYIKSLKFSNLI